MTTASRVAIFLGRGVEGKNSADRPDWTIPICLTPTVSPLVAVADEEDPVRPSEAAENGAYP